MTKRTVDRVRAQRNELARCMRMLTDEVIDDLDRIGAFSAVPDGFPPGGDGVGGGSEVARPTESAVLARQARPTADPMGKLVRSILGSLGAAAMALEHVPRSLEVVRGYGAPATVALRDAGPSGDCECCTRVVAGTPSDRLVGGFCDKCRKAWDRYRQEHPLDEAQGDPGLRRIAFVRERRVKLAERLEAS